MTFEERYVHGRKVVATPGYPVPLADVPTPVKWVTIQALRGNTGYAATGSRLVRAQTGELNSLSLAVPAASTPQMETYTNVDLQDVWIDASVADEGVAFKGERA